MRRLALCLIAASLFTQAHAAELLAPGRPAGVQTAQKGGPNMYLVVGVATLAVAGVAALMANGNSALATTVIPGGQQPPVPITNTVIVTSSTATST